MTNWTHNDIKVTAVPARKKKMFLYLLVSNRIVFDIGLNVIWEKWRLVAYLQISSEGGGAKC